MQDKKPALAGAFYAWPPYTDTGAGYTDNTYVFKPSPNGKWIAVTGTEGTDWRVFAIWEIGPSGALAERLPDPFPEGHGVLAFAWCGERLVFCEGRGFGRLSTLEDERNMATANLVVYDPATRSVVKRSPGLAFFMAGDLGGERLTAIGMGEAGEATVVFRLPDLERIAEPPISREVGKNTTRSTPWPLGWAGTGSGWYALEDRVTTRRGMKSRGQMLSFWTTEGKSHDLGEMWSVYRPAARPWQPPVPTLLEDSAGVIGILEPLDAMPSVRVLRHDAPPKSYDLYPGETLPEKLNALLRRGGYRFITGAPDGRRAILQERLRDKEGRSSTGPSSVWCTDLERKTAFEVTTIGAIDQCFGWLSDDALIVRVARPRGKAGRTSHDYGVLHLRKPPESQADETEGQQQRQKGDD